MASPCLCKPPVAPGVASHVEPVTKLPFGRASPGAARGAAPEALPNGAIVVNAGVKRSDSGYKISTIFLVT